VSVVTTIIYIFLPFPIIQVDLLQTKKDLEAKLDDMANDDGFQALVVGNQQLIQTNGMPLIFLVRASPYNVQALQSNSFMKKFCKIIFLEEI
jgi:hypothetical protein